MPITPTNMTMTPIVWMLNPVRLTDTANAESPRRRSLVLILITRFQTTLLSPIFPLGTIDEPSAAYFVSAALRAR